MVTNQNLPYDHENCYENSVQIQLRKIQFVGYYGIVDPLRDFRQKFHRNLDRLLIGLDGGQEHPHKGAKGQKRRKTSTRCVIPLDSGLS